MTRQRVTVRLIFAFLDNSEAPQGNKSHRAFDYLFRFNVVYRKKKHVASVWFSRLILEQRIRDLHCSSV